MFFPRLVFTWTVQFFSHLVGDKKLHVFSKYSTNQESLSIVFATAIKPLVNIAQIENFNGLEKMWPVAQKMSYTGLSEERKDILFPRPIAT